MNKDEYKIDYYGCVKDYIDNEIQYIIESMTSDRLHIVDYAKDLAKISELDDVDILNITNKVWDDDQLSECLNETIHHYLYHYRKETNNENNC